MDINMKKVGNKYEPDSIDMDPFSEYVHPQNISDQSSQKIEVEPQQSADQQEEYVPLQGVAQLNKNIDDFFDGVDMFFNLTDRVMGRIGGKNARSSRRIK